MKKYEFTGETLKDEIPIGVEAREHVTVYQIRALIDIPAHNVKKGDLGGWIEKEENLSHEGNCWLGNGIVSGSSTIKGDILVGDNEYEESSCYIRGNSHIEGTGLLSGVVVDNSIINGHILSYGTSFDFSYVEGNIKAFEGLLKQCHVKSSGDKIVFSHCVLIPTSGRLKVTNCDNKPLTLDHVCIDFENATGDHFIDAFGEMKHVYSDGLSKLNLSGQLDICNVYLDEKASFLITNTSEKVILRGESDANPIYFADGVKELSDVTLEGNVTLKGNMSIQDSSISNCSGIENLSEENLVVKNITMCDCSKIERRANSDKHVENISFVADDKLVI